MNNGVFIILPYVIIYEDVLHTLIKGVNPKWLPPTNGEGITRPPRENHRKSWERGKTQRKSTWATGAYHSKWSWNPPRPWTELRYWYRPRSPLRVDTRSSSRVSTIPLLLQRIFPRAMFTFNWNTSRDKNEQTSHMWEPPNCHHIYYVWQDFLIYLKVRQWLNLLRWLRDFKLLLKVLMNLSTCTFESILCRSINRKL